MLVDEGVVLRNELPADFRGVYAGVGHDWTEDSAASMSIDLESLRGRVETYRGCRRREERNDGDEEATQARTGENEGAMSNTTKS